MNAVRVSVVMGVHNGGGGLAATLDSVLAQQGIDLEFVVVDDGSTDGTSALLSRYAATDRRMRVLTHSQNLGLTEALIQGCGAARGQFIARQDAGDRSLPDRLRKQADWLEANTAASMVSCHTRNLGLYGELAYERRIAEKDLNASLHGPLGGIARGPSHHGSVMMRASEYRRSGGYRRQFVVAQDIDLWLRLVECGPIGVIDEVLYESQLSPSGISASRAAMQAALCALAVRLAEERRKGGSADEEALLQAARVPERGLRQDCPPRLARRAREAAYLYFLGRCVAGREPALARRYFRSALRIHPWHLRSWYGLARSWLWTAHP